MRNSPPLFAFQSTGGEGGGASLAHVEEEHKIPKTSAMAGIKILSISEVLLQASQDPYTKGVMHPCRACMAQGGGMWHYLAMSL